MRTAGQLATLIKQEVKMDLAEIGDTDSEQNQYIFDFISLALRGWAKLAYRTEVSDTLTIGSDGYVKFQKGGSDVSDMYEPLRILDSNGNEVRRRTSFSGAEGWFKESANADIHVKGFKSGDYTLHYIRYPKWISSPSDVPEWPEAGYMALIFQVCGMIKESKNFYDESQAMYAKAERHLNAVAMANDSARGTRTIGAYQDLARLKG